MVEISVELFRAFEKKEGYIFFFSIPGLCGLCKIQEQEYNKYNILNLIKVSGTITDEEYFQTLGIDALPCTVLFNKDGSIKAKKYGVLYESQIQNLLKGIGSNEK